MGFWTKQKFLYLISKAPHTKGIMDRIIKIKKKIVCYKKKHIEMKTISTDRKKISLNHMSNKGVIARIHKELKKK